MEIFTYHPIGILHTPFTEASGMPIQPHGALGVKGSIELFPEFADGLKDLETFSHIILLYHFHRAPSSRLRVVPFMDSEEHGVFATRAPTRPNPIGLSVVRLREVQGTRLAIENVDMLDGTPLLDIKPYAPAFDHWEVESAGWLTTRQQQVQATRSDKRFE
ncbi:MAG: tRNA (N6-threonylcarbamoyladenosine(37)-N6)-methyltransferase TrmO [Anaerolineae bacterium]|jgi:tRNA-Thr(GGU) m(6)t(6)A37 methyltransferase TsaA|nr:tRNA (N6-threonylcarbamoyladenosine(37)-N6)-methyltransferase TrmO [Anaerolineae bacterium]